MRVGDRSITESSTALGCCELRVGDAGGDPLWLTLDAVLHAAEEAAGV